MFGESSFCTEKRTIIPKILKIDHFLYSGDKKHIVAGIAVFTIIFGIPWYFMNRGFRVCTQGKIMIFT
ncbi:hypothetical protein RGQ29_031340 [Quercus rubra]|uniref:Uncharacterized protein n=1 Tax=Quercus rubra TaxID=3512 RepID=A0AAN7EK28_QUERU|nr:hypothetical protein RGQ29_031340 [Quercus rubra]